MRLGLHRVLASGLLAACALVPGLVAAPAAARPINAHGQLLRLIRPPQGRLNAGQSSNWFGYNQGALESGGGLFHSIAANWTVPHARQHQKGQAEDSSDWIGIGGGCVNSGCGVSDSTLIQTGTEQDVAAGGAASYSAWWEVIPAPSVPIAMTIRPGDHMHASIVEVLPEVWEITLADLTTKKSHSLRVPYSSTQDSAEWIEETPLVLGANAGFAPCPALLASF